MSHWIQTYSGKAFDLLDPQPDMVDFDDIAHALSLLCRFSGHTRRHYSVAQHSVMVASQLPAKLQLAGLLHDAHEAYIGDISTPMKRALFKCESYDLYTIESNIQRAIHEAAGLPLTLTNHEQAQIKDADLRALMTERRDLMGPSPAPWGKYEDIEPLDEPIVPWEARGAKGLFRVCLRELRGRIAA